MAAFDRFLSQSGKKGHTVPVFSKSAPRAASEAGWVEATVRPQTGSNEDRLAASPPWWATAGIHQPNVGKNRGRELSLAGAATSIIFVTTKVVSRHTCLSQQTYFCRNKSFVVTNICCDKHNFTATNILSLQAYFCHDKHVFVSTKHIFCHDKSMLVATKLLSWQTQQIFVVTIVLLQQKYFCHDIMTNII